MNLFASMRVFVKIVDKGSLTAAADALGISSAMVGNHLQALEEHLGQRLLHRTTRRQNLTDAGNRYYHRCVDILAQVTEAEALAKHEEAPNGSLRITAPISLGTEIIVPALEDFYRHYPQIKIDLVLGDRVLGLLEDDIDIAIRIGQLPDSGDIARYLGEYSMSVCASPSYLEAHGIPTKPEQLGDHNCLLFNNASAQWKFEYSGKRTQINVSGNLVVNNGQALRRAACDGLGVIMQPHLLVRDAIERGRLVHLFQQYQLPSRDIHIVYLKDRFMPPKIRCFIDFAVDYFAGNCQ